jgi:NADPH-dependent 7-cyano-7-deazaguanine reductase QueF-like protein
MGLTIIAVTDTQLTECEVIFSKSFCYFLCGLDAHTNHELGQLEQVLDCDLSVLKQMDLYHYS